MAERQYRWYLHPLGERSNEIIAKNVGCEEEFFHAAKMCADGVARSLWECPSLMIDFLISSSKGLGIKFLVFGQEGNGKIHDKTKWRFNRNRRKLKRRAIRH